LAFPGLNNIRFGVKKVLSLVGLRKKFGKIMTEKIQKIIAALEVAKFLAYFQVVNPTTASLLLGIKKPLFVLFLLLIVANSTANIFLADGVGAFFLGLFLVQGLLNALTLYMLFFRFSPALFYYRFSLVGALLLLRCCGINSFLAVPLEAEDFDGALFFSLLNYLILLNSHLELSAVFLLLVPLGPTAVQLAGNVCAMQSSTEVTRALGLIKAKPEIIVPPQELLLKQLPLKEEQWQPMKNVSLAYLLNPQDGSLGQQEGLQNYRQFVERQRALFPEGFFLYQTVEKKMLVQNYEFYRWFAAVNRNLNEGALVTVFSEIYKGETEEMQLKLVRSSFVHSTVLNQKLIGSKGFSLARVLEIPPKDAALAGAINSLPESSSQANIFGLGQSATDNIVAAAAYGQAEKIDLNAPEYTLVKTKVDACIRKAGLEGFTSLIEVKHPYKLPEPANMEDFLVKRFRDFFLDKALPQHAIKACVLIGSCGPQEEASLRSALEIINKKEEYVERHVLFILVCESIASLD
jgi:hypothetical protein